MFNIIIIISIVLTWSWDPAATISLLAHLWKLLCRWTASPRLCSTIVAVLEDKYWGFLRG